MPVFSPKFLASAAGARWTKTPAGSSPVTGFSVDTRHIAPGDCFVALRTARRDGHAFLAAAKEAGASAAIVSVENPDVDLPQLVAPSPLAAFQAIAAAHRQSFPGPVIGVTGSAGKTSTKELLALLLSSSPGDVLATTGNLNNHLGVPLTLTRLDPSVHKFAVIEAGIGGPGEMSVLAGMIRPSHAIVTLIGPAHLATLGTLANVAREKAQLPAAVPAGGLRVFGVDCLNYHEFRSFPSPGVVVAPAIANSETETRITIAPNVSGGPAPRAVL
jgi:UDP-N-acetylmuramoyl-tripeptide--D-alanyl-D-alanine ligase